MEKKWGGTGEDSFAGENGNAPQGGTSATIRSDRLRGRKTISVIKKYIHKKYFDNIFIN